MESKESTGRTNPNVLAPFSRIPSGPPSQPQKSLTAAAKPTAPFAAFVVLRDSPPMAIPLFPRSVIKEFGSPMSSPRHSLSVESKLAGMRESV